MNAANANANIYSPCASCDRKTFHDILHSDVQSEEEYRMDTINEMLRCKGCHSISFRRVIRDYEVAYPDDHSNEWIVPESIVNYPAVLDGHKELKDVSDIPKLVRDIYRQSVEAIKSRSNTIAGIGLRATIEAICNDQFIKGRTLENRIDSLWKSGRISKKDAERLHAIRFLGNDAAHDIKRASSKNLLIALRIIEHLLVNIYILDDEANGELETIIKKFSDFEKILDEKLLDMDVGQELPLVKIFGRDVRRLHGYISEHEAELKKRIIEGAYTKLCVGKVAKFANSKSEFQHFTKK